MPLAVYYLNQAMTTVSIQDELQAIKNAALYRRLRRVENDQGPTLILDGREVINFSSNNYLGIANHPALAQAAKQAIDRYGCGAGASRLISGNMALHEELENRLAKFKGTEAALVFNSGFQANTGILSALTGETDAILSDALNHASIIDGCRLSRAKTFVYAHCDLNGLETVLKQAAGVRRRLIVTETIFSMTNKAINWTRQQKALMAHLLSQTPDVARDSYDSILPSFSLDGSTVDKTFEFAIESRKATVRAEKAIPLSQVRDLSLLREVQKELRLQ